MAKCPPGVICFENFTFTFIILAILVILYIIYIRNNNSIGLGLFDFRTTIENSNQIPNSTISIERNQYNPFLSAIYPKANFSFTQDENSVLMNPYVPPLKDDRLIRTNDIRGGVPINVNTRAVDTSYRQVGILKRMNGPEMILPLMGRPLYVGRDKWQYYTMSDSNNAIKLPISFKSKSCTNEYGCDEVSNGDTVYVDGIDATFQATIYDSNIMRYIPFI